MHQVAIAVVTSSWVTMWKVLLVILLVEFPLVRCARLVQECSGEGERLCPGTAASTAPSSAKVQCLVYNVSNRSEHQRPWNSCRGAAIENEKNSKKNQPHIVVVLFDDLGYHDLGEFSDTKRHLCHTPVMNNLLATGVKLKEFYAMPICSPTRASY